jgi:hypothetical protein
LLSFPRPGFTLTLDFANSGPATLKMLDALDEIVLSAGGALNPYKDQRMSAEMFEASFPNWRELEAVRDPALMSDFWRRTAMRFPSLPGSRPGQQRCQISLIFALVSMLVIGLRHGAAPDNVGPSRSGLQIQPGRPQIHVPHFHSRRRRLGNSARRRLHASGTHAVRLWGRNSEICEEINRIIPIGPISIRRPCRTGLTASTDMDDVLSDAEIVLFVSPAQTTGEISARAAQSLRSVRLWLPAPRASTIRVAVCKAN